MLIKFSNKLRLKIYIYKCFINIYYKYYKYLWVLKILIHLYYNIVKNL